MIEELTVWFESNAGLIQMLGRISLVFLIVTVLALPLVIKHLPVDYFVADKRDNLARRKTPRLLWLALNGLKNLVGLVLIFAGLVMLVLPGQGMVTILAGISLTNFPGKYALERKIISQPSVGRAFNRIRSLTDQPPLRFPA